MKVLVADDDPTLRMLMRELLRRNLDCEVIEAEGGSQAWQLLESQPAPDLCIFDVLMPQVSGLDLLAKIRNDPRLRRLKIMLCSSVNEQDGFALGH
jgi:CheY-like chemotaxis protein